MVTRALQYHSFQDNTNNLRQCYFKVRGLIEKIVRVIPIGKVNRAKMMLTIIINNNKRICNG